jgi:hypothetical protein
MLLVHASLAGRNIPDNRIFRRAPRSHSGIYVALAFMLKASGEVQQAR